MTTSNYAIVENGTVTNVVIWDGNTETWQPPTGAQAVLATEDAIIGATYDGTKFTPAAGG